jgi:hypothetical protein
MQIRLSAIAATLDALENLLSDRSRSESTSQSDVLPYRELQDLRRMMSEMNIGCADSAATPRKTSLSLHWGFRHNWSCECKGCPGLSVGLALPKAEPCLNVFCSSNLPWG